MDEQQIEQLKQQAEECMAGWKRAQADYQNLKRDGERQKDDYIKFANERLLQNLLPAFDQFNLALAFLPSTQSLPEQERKIWDNWLLGVKAVQSLWEQSASAIGLERIPTEGAFDPQLHEAVGEEESSEKEPHAIIRVTQDGWRLNGKVLRPAKVIVAKG